MPRPDAEQQTADYREQLQEQQRKQSAKTKKIINACNALLHKQLECVKACHNCPDKCEEMQMWLDLEEK